MITKKGYIIRSGDSYAAGFTDSGYKYFTWTNEIGQAMILISLDRAKDFLEVATKKARERLELLRLDRSWMQEIVDLHESAEIVEATITYDLKEID